jgi:transcriptional regulator with XRE-family HTH domain
VRCTVLLAARQVFPGQREQKLSESTVGQAPEVARRRLRSELRRLRLDSQLTQRDVACGLDWSVSKLVRIEAGLVDVSPADLSALLGMYGITEETDPGLFDELGRTCRQSRQAVPFYLDRVTELLGPALENSHGDISSPVTGRKNELTGLLSAVKAERSWWIAEDNRERPNAPDNGWMQRIAAANRIVTDDDATSNPVTVDIGRSFASFIVALLGRILSLLQSALARLMLARMAVAACALTSALIVAAFMSHRHRHEPADGSPPLVARYRALAGAAAAW